MVKQFLIGLLIAFSAFPVSSQSAEGRYASRMTPDGSIFFIMPHKLSKTEGIKKFEYDMTLLSWTDSVTVNFTFRSLEMGIPKSLSIGNNVKNFKCDNYSLLFMDILKQGYEIRVTSKFASTDIKTLFDSESPLIFNFIQGDTQCYATYKESAWKKDRKKLNDIYQLYLYAK